MEKMENFYRDVRLEELDNGLKFLYKYFPGKLVGVSIFVKAGSGEEGKFLGSGIAHLTEHLLFEGRRDLEEELRKLGAISNAYTTLDHALYHFEVPRENLKEALQIFLSAVFSPSIDQATFAREKEVVLKEEKFRDDDPSSLLVKIGFNKSYLHHPYKYPIIGEASLLKGISLEDLIEFHSSRYLPNNAVIAVVGDCDYDEVKELITSIASKFNPRPISLESFPPEKKNFRLDYSRSYPGSVAYVFVSFPGISMFEEDLPALDLLLDYLGWGKDSPLYKRFIETRICYNLSPLNYAPYFQGLLGFVAVLEKSKLEIFKSELENFLEEVRDGKFDHSRIERLKKRTSYEFLKVQESPLSISQSLARDQGLSGNFKFAVAYLNKFLTLTSDQLERVAKRYLNLNSSTWVMLLPGEIEKPKPKPELQERKYQKVEYPNGLKLVLAESKLSPLVAVTVLFEGGLRVEDVEINGISQLLPKVLITSELERKFDELGGKIRASSGNNSLGFEIEVLQNNLEQALAIIAELITRPRFDPQELEVQKNIQLGKIKDLEIDLFYQGFKLLRQNVYKKHPYRLVPEGRLDSVSKMKVEDLKDFSERLFVPNNCVISIAGNIDAEKVRDEIDRLFSSWKRKELEINPPQDPYIQKNLFVEKKIPQREVIIEIGFMVPEITSPYRYHLNLMQALVSGQGSIFFNRIRKELGASYTLGAVLFLGPEPGLLSFYVATTPENKDKVLNKMQEIIEDLRAGNISEEEIQDAKKFLRSKFYRETLSNASLSFYLAVEESIGSGYQEIESHLDRIERISREDFLEFVRKYIRLENAVVVEVGNL